MRLLNAATTLCALFLPSTLVYADSTSSRLSLPPDFKPPQVFKNTNLVRNTNLEKGYVRETVNVVVENIGKKPQSDYYLPFPTNVYDKVGALEVRDKKAPEKGRFDVETTEVELSR
ncbi:oligosaccharyltransferase alpha subunit [Aspergillus sclerotialis]|uniref:Dolichyl-diphosphooligosaccharide--protein glycosyltransferase subunit 1 n=1 Tax=Aspergillus sclerotialis TaxID=2070753 RepID=A0A3A3A9D5_9EURO|nr:oligosaccharyltransferase alpha subunit [Aspergillus sclerotialis]